MSLESDNEPNAYYWKERALKAELALSGKTQFDQVAAERERIRAGFIQQHDSAVKNKNAAIGAEEQAVATAPIADLGQAQFTQPEGGVCAMKRIVRLILNLIYLSKVDLRKELDPIVEIKEL